MPAELVLVIPTYNEYEFLSAFIDDIKNTVEDLVDDYKVCIVDDGSIDGTWKLIESICLTQKGKVVGVKLSKNFGKDKAILAGLQQILADAYLVIDADGEHPISSIKEFVNKWKQTGCDVIHGVKSERNKGFFYTTFSKLFNLSLSRFSRLNLVESSDFKLMSRKFVEAILEYGDYEFFFRGVAQDAGFTSEVIWFKEGIRQYGNRRWSNLRLVRYALNILIGFTRFPLQLIIAAGLFSIGLATILLLKTIIGYFQGIAPGGYPTMLGVALLSLGLIMSSIGILGVYLAKIYDEVKGRPRFLIDKIAGTRATDVGEGLGGQSDRT
jgi:dolichol-phosphate mannosyltransferase